MKASQSPQSPTPEWAVALMKRVVEFDDPDLLDTVLELVAGIVPDKTTDKFKYEAAWAAIDYGFTKTAALREAAARYVGVALFKSGGLTLTLYFLNTLT